ncbi:MAG: L,D-transpeptidase, partial [Deltaproteobacteria bacterium]|nr:L,D-transpeptidase [Deltaproteobacteria bacterium]
MKYLILTLFLTGFFSFPLSEETFVWASQKTSESESKPSSETQASTPPESNPKLSESRLSEAPAIRLSINIPSRKLLVFQNEKVIKEYLVAIGSPLHPTP